MQWIVSDNAVGANYYEGRFFRYQFSSPNLEEGTFSGGYTQKTGNSYNGLRRGNTNTNPESETEA